MIPLWKGVPERVTGRRSIAVGVFDNHTSVRDPEYDILQPRAGKALDTWRSYTDTLYTDILQLQAGNAIHAHPRGSYTDIYTDILQLRAGKARHTRPGTDICIFLQGAAIRIFCKDILQLRARKALHTPPGGSCTWQFVIVSNAFNFQL